MRKLFVATAIVVATAAAASAQEPPYTVRHGQVTYPGQMQWNAPVDGYGMAYYGDRYDVDPYYGGASIALPGPFVYAPPAPFYDGPRYAMRPHYDDPDYNEHGRGAFIFDGAVVNSDQNYSGR